MQYTTLENNHLYGSISIGYTCTKGDVTYSVCLSIGYEVWTYRVGMDL